MIDQIKELHEDRLKSSPKTSRFTENKWISRKNQNKLYFLHLIDILNDIKPRYNINNQKKTKQKEKKT